MYSDEDVATDAEPTFESLSPVGIIHQLIARGRREYETGAYRPKPQPTRRVSKSKRIKETP
jgi:hypothetical protein